MNIQNDDDDGNDERNVRKYDISFFSLFFLFFSSHLFFNKDNDNIIERQNEDEPEKEAKASKKKSS